MLTVFEDTLIFFSPLLFKAFGDWEKQYNGLHRLRDHLKKLIVSVASQPVHRELYGPSSTHSIVKTVDVMKLSLRCDKSCRIRPLSNSDTSESTIP